jgi:exopolyphosphatase/pppGpp-phosphohydrolase
MRVDMIVISVLLIDFILNELQLKHMRVSTFSLKEGVISKKLRINTFLINSVTLKNDYPKSIYTIYF